MQTFLPYPDFEKSARCLDRQRLGKQRVEAMQILSTLRKGGSTGWANHPAAKMWRGYEDALTEYLRVTIEEWIRRGYQNTMILPTRRGYESPPWLGQDKFHASHRSNLLRKDALHYGQFGWTEPSDLPYYWPSSSTGEENNMTTAALKTTKIDHKSMNIEQLQEAHSDMLATAGDLGMEVPPELQVEFDDPAKGNVLCDKLHDAIEKFSKGLNEKDTGAEKKAAATTATPKTKKASVKKTSAKKAAAKPAKEKKVAKKAAKKAAPKKGAAKKVGVKKTDDLEKKITVVKKEHPFREGSGKAKRVDKLFAHSGKTVGAFLKAGGKRSTLSKCVSLKLVKVA